MVKRRVFDDAKHVHFVTFACFRRRRHLQHDRARRTVIGEPGSRLATRSGLFLGFLVMNDHVHAMVWFPEVRQLSLFMNKRKEQMSKTLKNLLSRCFPNYWSTTDRRDPIWQARYYGVNIWSRSKVEEKLDDMHLNPVRAGLVERAVDWRWSSARWYFEGRSVGLPIRWPPGLETDDAQAGLFRNERLVKKHFVPAVPNRPMGGRTTLRYEPRPVGDWKKTTELS